MDSKDKDWLSGRLDRLQDKQEEMNVVLIENTAQLKEHMRRTALLELEVKPIKKHVQFVNDAAKIVSVALTAVLAAHTLGII